MMKFPEERLAESKKTTTMLKSEDQAGSVAQDQWLHLDKTVSLVCL